MTTLTLEENLLRTWRTLPVKQKQSLLDFAQFLQQKGSTPRARHNPEGLWASFAFEITDDDIVQARQEMWGTFPRELE